MIAACPRSRSPGSASPTNAPAMGHRSSSSMATSGRPDDVEAAARGALRTQFTVVVAWDAPGAGAVGTRPIRSGCDSPTAWPDSSRGSDSNGRTSAGLSFGGALALELYRRHPGSRGRWYSRRRTPGGAARCPPTSPSSAFDRRCCWRICHPTSSRPRSCRRCSPSRRRRSPSTSSARPCWRSIRPDSGPWRVLGGGPARRPARCQPSRRSCSTATGTAGTPDRRREPARGDRRLHARRPAGHRSCLQHRGAPPARGRGARLPGRPLTGRPPTRRRRSDGPDRAPVEPGAQPEAVHPRAAARIGVERPRELELGRAHRARGPAPRTISPRPSRTSWSSAARRSWGRSPTVAAGPRRPVGAGGRRGRRVGDDRRRRGSCDTCLFRDAGDVDTRAAWFAARSAA